MTAASCRRTTFTSFCKASDIPGASFSLLLVQIFAEMDDVVVGTRVVYGDRRGTVCYIGPLHSPEHPGVFAGIEWDDSQSGLHDGVFRGTRFFHCRPSRGSFVPLDRLNCGQTLVDALIDKYGTAGDMDVGVSFGSKQVVAVGWEKVMKKISNLERLSHVDLTGFHVRIPESRTDDLCQLIPNVRTLGLGQSLIGSWTAVLSLIQPLVHLETLDLSDNRLAFDVDLPGAINLRIKRLVLRKNALKWEDVERILQIFPNVECLYLAENHIDSCYTNVIGRAAGALKVLDLDSQLSQIADFAALLPLGRFLCLESLQLSGNAIKDISFGDVAAGGKIELFPGLTSLTLKLNAISSWSSIDELDKLKSLENLKISGNPFLDNIPPETARQWLIAKIASLKVLNQTPISQSERRDSELDYMRHFARDYLSSDGDSVRRAAFLSAHPRFLDIVSYLGPLEQDAFISAQSLPPMGRGPLMLTLQHRDRQHQKSLPPTISVMKLKRMFQRLFPGNVEMSSGLVYRTPSKPGVDFELDDDQKEIAHYDVRSGDIVVLKSTA